MSADGAIDGVFEQRRRALSADELQRVKRVYQSRLVRGVIGRYSLLRDGELFMAHGRERTLLRLLKRFGLQDLSSTRILEIGCGRGHRLLDWIRWGGRASNLFGIDLMEALLREARADFAGSSFAAASGTSLPFRDSEFDVVAQLTVISSILDPSTRQLVAREMLRVTRPGGLILSYDFRYPSPRNPDVRPVGLRELRRLFPGCAIDIISTTLLPPLARSIAPISFLVCELLALLPPLRSHYAAAVVKPNILE